MDWVKRLQVIDKLQQLDPEQLSIVYIRLFNTDDGQIVLEDLRQRCFYDAPTTGRNEFITYENNGMRGVVLHIETQLKPIRQEV